MVIYIRHYRRVSSVVKIAINGSSVRVIFTLFFLMALGGCSSTDKSDKAPFTPLGYWTVSHYESCTKLYGNTGTTIYAAEISAATDDDNRFFVRRLDNNLKYALRRDESNNWHLFVDGGIGNPRAEGGKPLPMGRPEFPVRVTGTDRMVGEAQWDVPSVDMSCSLVFSAERYPGPKVCEVMTADETKVLVASAQSALAGPDIQALHQFWAEHASKWQAAAALTDGTYQWQGAWKFSGASTQLELTIPSAGTVTFEGNDLWSASLVGTSMAPWKVQQFVPDYTETHNEVTFGEWGYLFETCMWLCSNRQQIALSAPFGFLNLFRGEGRSPNFPWVNLSLSLNEQTFKLQSVHGNKQYRMSYGTREKTLSEDEITKTCPNFVLEKIAMFPDVGTELTVGFPFANFGVVK